MVGRVPCGVCNLQVSTPNNFLLVCRCGIACHHTCFKPPMAQSSLLAMIDAFNRGVHEESIRAWRCAVCTSTASVPQSPFYANPPSYINMEQRYYDPGPHDKKTIVGAPAPPKASQSRPRIDSLRSRDVQYVSDANHPGRNEKNVVNGRTRGWRKNALTPLRPSQPKLHMGPSAAAWPPVRHKNKTHTHPAPVKIFGEPTSLNVKVASTKQAESADSVKAFVRLRSPASKGLCPKPMLDSPVSTASTNRNSHAPKLKKAADGSLLSPPDRSMLAQTIETSNNGRTIHPAICNGVVNHSHTGEDVSKNLNTLPKSGDDVEDVFIDSHLENDADSRNKMVTQITFPVLPSTNARGFHDLPSSPTALGRPPKRKRPPDAAMQSTSGEEASNTPFTSTPLQWTPPFVDLQKVLERKRSTVQRNASVPSLGSNLNAPGLKWRAIGVSRQDSGSDLYPLLKRRKLDLGNTQKPGEQTSRGKADVETQEWNPVPVATGEHAKPVDSSLPPNVQTNEQAQKSLPTKSMTQLSQAIELSHPQLYPPETEAETRHATADHHANEENKQLFQLASPATSHRSLEALPQDDSPARATKPGSPPAAVLSPPEKFLPIHDQMVTESHLPPPSIPTPRSLSPARHPIIRSVLDDVVARLQLQSRRPDHMRPLRYPESKVKLPQLARWFKEIGTNLITTGTRDKRKRWKAPNPKEMMVGSSEGWSFVGAHVRTT